MSKTYTILLGSDKIGTTKLEKADAPMGVVFGKIDFLDISSGYFFIKDYCTKNGISFTDYPAEKLISTTNITNLRVLDINEIEVKGGACTISGADEDIFEIVIEGIESSCYEREFPHHIDVYNDLFKGNK